MKPSFALNLSPEGIALLHRTSRGWFNAGEVSFDDPRLSERLAFLRRTAAELAPQGVTSKVILPNSQILYTEIEAPGPDRATRRAQIARALEGRTPYAVSDLVFDWSGTGPRVQVAVVARITLDEAEAFAEEHRFAPVSFVAIPEEGRFAGEPWFGTTRGAETHVPAGERIERDQDPVRIIARAEAPVVTAAQDAAPDGAQEGAQDFGAPDDRNDGPADAETADTGGAVDAEPPTSPEAAAGEPRADDPAPADADPVAALSAPGPLPPPVAPRLTPVPQTAAGDEAPMLVDAEPEDLAESGQPAALFLRHGSVPAPSDEPQAAAAPDTPQPTVALGILAPDVDAPPEPEPDRPLRAQRPPAPPRPAAPKAILRTTPATPPPAPLRTPPKSAETEERELTVFGARRRPEIGGKPRYLGLALAATLAFGLGAVALWSSLGDEPAPTTDAVAGATAGATGPAQTDPVELPPPFKPAPAPEPTAEAAAEPTPEAAPETAPETATETAPADGAGAATDTAEAATDSPDETPPPTDAEATTPPAPAPVDEGGIEGALAEAMGSAPPQAPAATVPAQDAPADAAPSTAAPAAPAAQAQSSSVSTAGGPALVATPDAATAAAGAQVWGETGPADVDATAAMPEAGPQPAEPLPQAPLAENAAPAADSAPPQVAPPVPFGSLLQIGPDGLIVAKPDGVVTPDGFTLFAGRPPAIPRSRPATVAEAARIAAGLPPPDPLEGKRPQPRPATLVPPAAPAVAPAEAPAAAPADRTDLAPPVDPAHAALKPRGRPPAVVAAAGTASAQSASQSPAPASALAPLPPPVDPAHAALKPRRPTASVQAAVAAETALAEARARSEAAMAAASRYAVDTSRRPARRPSDYADAVEAAIAAAVATPAVAAEPPPAPEALAAAPHDEIDEPEPVSAAPSIPTRASVAKQATIANVLDLGDINLIGVYGAPKDRRALVRLSTGRYVKVQVGDRLDGGKVAAIGDGQLSYVKNGRTIVLKMIKES